MTTVVRRSAGGSTRWRTVDIVVASVLAVAFGVVFWGWNTLYEPVSALFAAFPPAKGLLIGVWLLPGVVGGLVIRKPGAAVFTELVAAIVSALLGSQWGLSVVWYGLLEGLGPELVFLARRYRSWSLATALLAGAAAGVAATFLDLVFYYPTWTAGWKSAYAAFVIPAAAVVAGLGGWLLVRALAPTGVLAPFASGREQRVS
jgi:energy-coupling factor transport system substrate-specific component